jgi:hypothetical protein
MTNASKRDQLLADGFCTFDDILDSSMLDELRRLTHRLIADWPATELQRVRYQGSNVPIRYDEPVFADLISHQLALQAN